MTKCVTNFTRTALHHWTASKAIMEFVQNWLDSDGERCSDFGDDYITLTNKNIRVSNKFLLMGASDKRGCDDKRGQYGMGSGQALVVLTDLGINVEIQNNGIIWTPYWEYLENFDAEVLVISETNASKPHNNFIIKITNISADIIDEVKQRCLMFQDRDVLHSTSIGDIINNVDGGGEVYAGDIYVCQNSNFKYSYNFKPKMLKLSQDRDAVSQWDLQELTAKLINMTGDAEFITQAIKANTLDTQRLNGYVTDRTTKADVNDKFAQEFLEEHGVALVTDDYTEHQNNVMLGNKSVYINNERQVIAIRNSSVYADAMANVELVEKESFNLLFERLRSSLFDYFEGDFPSGMGELLNQVIERVNNADFD